MLSERHELKDAKHAEIVSVVGQETPDATGVARLRVTLASRGTWTVRVVALRTPTNAIGTWSVGPRYEVR